MSADEARPVRSGVGLALAAGIGMAILIALGLWQLERMREKAQFLAAITTAAKGPARPDFAAAPEFSRVALTGRYRPAETSFVRAVMGNGIGLFVMTPLQPASGPAILVNRGFLPTAPDGRPPAVATEEGEVTVTGFKRLPEAQSLVTAADEPRARIFAARDPARIAAAGGFSFATDAYLEAARSPGAGPQGVDIDELIARVPNNHQQYALTWFGLAAALAGVYVALARQRRRERLPTKDRGL